MVAHLNKMFRTAFWGAVVVASTSAIANTGSFDNPVDGATSSGVGVISGWHCTAQEIRISIDGVDMGKAGSGTKMLGTVPVCGHAETGFSLLYNWNNLTEGQHVVSAYADGALLGTKTITTVKSAGQQFASGLSRSTVIEGFPTSNESTRLEWRQATQSFVATDRYGNTNSLNGNYTLYRLSIQYQNGSVVDTKMSNVDASGTLSITNSYVDMRIVMTVNGVQTPVSSSGYVTDQNYYFSDTVGRNGIILDRGTGLVFSMLVYSADYGYANEIYYWSKVLD